MNILVHAYQVSPARGSEFSVAWNYIMNMSKNHNLYVICGQSNYKMGDFSELTEYLSTTTMKNVHFIMVKPSKMVSLLNLYNSYSFTSSTFYMAYKRWEKEVYQKLKQDVELLNKIDIIHYLGPIGYREPGYLWMFNKPYIWGPIGGLMNVKNVFIKKYIGINKMKIIIKNVINKLQLNLHCRVYKAMKKSDIVIAATTEQQKMVVNYFDRKDVLYQPENKILHIPFRGNGNEYIDKKYAALIENREKLNVVWVGSIVDRKMPFLVLDIAKKLNDDVSILMIGEGYLGNKIALEIDKSEKLKSKINLLGNLPRENVLFLLEKAHLHLLTSSMEANTSVVFEAMSLYTPTISLNHCGMADIICDNCGIRVPISSYDAMVNSFADSINAFLVNPGSLKKLSFGCVSCAEQLSWENQYVFWENCYKEVV